MTPANCLTPKSSVWRNICGSISCISRVLANFPLKFPNFRCHGNQGRSDMNVNDTGKLPDLKNPRLVQLLRLYFLYWPSFSHFSVKIPKFSLPRQLGSVWRKFQWHRQIAWPRKPPVWCNIHGSMSYIGRVMANFGLKFPNFRYHGNRGRCDVNFNDTDKLLDLENALFGATFMARCVILAELWLILG